LLGGGALLVVAVIALGGFMAWQLNSARADLERASQQAEAFKMSLAAGDQDGARKALSELQSASVSASSRLGGPQWALSTHVPGVGDDVSAVRNMTSALKVVSDQALPALADIAGQVDAKAFNPADGRIDVSKLTQIGPQLASSSRVITRANKSVQGIDPDNLLSRLRAPVTKAQDSLNDAASAVQRASLASTVLPRMLSGDHRYLLLFQNNAEVRATGGLPGAWAVLDVKDGKLTLGEQGTAVEFPERKSPILPISTQEKELFDTKLGTFFGDTNFTPDFPRTAQLTQAFLKDDRGIQVDGVLSVDPIALSYLLQGTGPVPVSGGVQLTSANAVDFLLNGIYVSNADPAAQDAFYSTAAKNIFDRITSGDGDPQQILRSLAKAGNEDRLLVWSQDPEVTSALATTKLSGVLPTGKQASPRLGFYLNDATGAKMQYYLDHRTRVKATKCSAAGAQTYETTSTFTSDAPADASKLPVSVQGPNGSAQSGSMLMNLYLYAPAGGSIKTVTIDGEDAGAFESKQDGRPVDIITIQVDPGQTVTVKSTTLSGKAQRGKTVVDATPLSRAGTTSGTVASAC
jgi:hypothetical protein